MSPRSVLTTALICTVLLVSGCKTMPVQPAATEDDAPTTGEAMQVDAREFDMAGANEQQELKLGEDDSVRFTVLGYPELASVTQVQKDGSISLPMVGEVKASGRDVRSIRDEVALRLADELQTRPVNIRLGDVVRLFVWRHPDLSSDSTVIADGSITFPLVGRMEAVGRSVPELTQEVTHRLAEYIQEPQVSLIPQNFNRDLLLQTRVSLTLEKVRSRSVAILGEVNAPGVQTMRGPSTRVMDVLAQAYHRNTADLNSVLVIRRSPEDKVVYRVLHLGDFMDGAALDQNIFLQPEDIVIVPKTTIAKVGEFIDQFFTRTKPVFDWWISLQQARYAEETAKSIQLYNKYLDNVLR